MRDNGIGQDISIRVSVPREYAHLAGRLHHAFYFVWRRILPDDRLWLEAYWSDNVEPLIPWSNDLDGPWLKAVRTDDPQEFPVTTPDASITFDAESLETTPAARLRIMVAWALATQLFFAIDDRHCALRRWQSTGFPSRGGLHCVVWF